MDPDTVERARNLYAAEKTIADAATENQKTIHVTLAVEGEEKLNENFETIFMVGIKEGSLTWSNLGSEVGISGAMVGVLDPARKRHLVSEIVKRLSSEIL